LFRWVPSSREQREPEQAQASLPPQVPGPVSQPEQARSLQERRQSLVVPSPNPPDKSPIHPDS
jgi:hypothetical protein